jgi:hypothetical protein
MHLMRGSLNTKLGHEKKDFFPTQMFVHPQRTINYVQKSQSFKISRSISQPSLTKKVVQPSGEDEIREARALNYIIAKERAEAGLRKKELDSKLEKESVELKKQQHFDCLKYLEAQGLNISPNMVHKDYQARVVHFLIYNRVLHSSVIVQTGGSKKAQVAKNESMPSHHEHSTEDLLFCLMRLNRLSQDIGQQNTLTSFINRHTAPETSKVVALLFSDKSVIRRLMKDRLNTKSLMLMLNLRVFGAKIISKAQEAADDSENAIEVNENCENIFNFVVKELPLLDLLSFVPVCGIINRNLPTTLMPSKQMRLVSLYRKKIFKGSHSSEEQLENKRRSLAMKIFGFEAQKTDIKALVDKSSQKLLPEHRTNGKTNKSGKISLILSSNQQNYKETKHLVSDQQNDQHKEHRTFTDMMNEINDSQIQIRRVNGNILRAERYDWYFDRYWNSVSGPVSTEEGPSLVIAFTFDLKKWVVRCFLEEVLSLQRWMICKSTAEGD